MESNSPESPSPKVQTPKFHEIQVPQVPTASTPNDARSSKLHKVRRMHECRTDAMAGRLFFYLKAGPIIGSESHQSSRYVWLIAPDFSAELDSLRWITSHVRG